MCGSFVKKLGVWFLLFFSVCCGLYIKWDTNVIYSAWHYAVRKNWSFPGNTNMNRRRSAREQHVPLSLEGTIQWNSERWGRVNNMWEVLFKKGERVNGFLPQGQKIHTIERQSSERSKITVSRTTLRCEKHHDSVKSAVSKVCAVTSRDVFWPSQSVSSVGQNNPVWR